MIIFQLTFKVQFYFVFALYGFELIHFGFVKYSVLDEDFSKEQQSDLCNVNFKLYENNIL